MTGRSEPLVAAALVATAAAAVVYTAVALRDAYVGDATIYLSYARNATEGHLFQFNAGEFSSGSTSPLWSLVLAVPYVVGAGLGGAKVVAAVVAVLAVATTFAAAARLAGSRVAAAAATLFVPGAMTFYPTSLYESGLVVTLSALALLAGARAADAGLARDWRVLWPLVAVWAALPLTRPDAVLLVGAQAVALLLAAAAPRIRAALTLGVCLLAAAIPSVVYFGYSLADLGTPSTSSDARAFALHEFAAEFVGPFYRSADVFRELFGSPWVFAFVAALAGLALQLRRRETRWIGVYGGLAIAGYVFLLALVAPALHDTPRYLLPVVPVVVCGAAGLLAALPPGRRAWAGVAVAAAAIGAASAAEVDHRVEQLRGFGITEREVFSRDVTDRLNRIARPGETVLSYEVQLRYNLRDDVDVLSQDGIIDGKVRPYQEDRDMTGFLLRYRPRWWIADENVRTRPYLRGSILERALVEFRRRPGLQSLTLDRVRFDLIERRSEPLAPGFGGWQMLFALSYLDHRS